MDADYKAKWQRSSSDLISAVVSLGFPEELGRQIVKNLGSPKAMDRMTSYLHYVKPGKAELVVDEMLGIMSEIEIWRDKKESQKANASYNELIDRGLDHNDP